MYHKKRSLYSDSGIYDIHENNRFSDGKHYNQKHKETDKKSRNNIKQDLKKLYL